MWKLWFDSYGWRSPVTAEGEEFSYSYEDMYQAFKARMESEFAESGEWIKITPPEDI